MGERECKTFRELRALLSELTEKQLDSRVLWWGDNERCGEIVALEITSEDLAQFGEGLEPASVFEAEELGDADYILPAGTPALVEK